MSQENGFTLIEVLLSLMIISIALLGLFHLERVIWQMLLETP